MKAPHRSADSPHDEQDGADSVARFAAKHAISRAQTYLEIAAGRLIARKVGSRTIITREDAAMWRRALPKMSARDHDDRAAVAAHRNVSRRDHQHRAPARRGDPFS